MLSLSADGLESLHPHKRAPNVSSAQQKKRKRGTWLPILVVVLEVLLVCEAGFGLN